MYNNVNPSLNTVSFTKQRNRWLPHNFPLHNYRTMQIQKQQRSTCGLKYFHKYLAHSSDFSAKFPAINKGLLSAFLPSDKLAPHFQWVIQQREWYHLCKHTWSKSTISSSAPPYLVRTWGCAHLAVQSLSGLQSPGSTEGSACQVLWHSDQQLKGLLTN